MESKELWTVVAISLVVAVIASVATANLTGNVIRVRPDASSQFQVYQKLEIDQKLANMSTYMNDLTQTLTFQQRQVVLDTINKGCEIYSVAVPNSTRQVTGDEICKERNVGTCIFTINYDRLTSQDMVQKCTPYVKGRSDKTVAYCRWVY